MNIRDKAMTAYNLTATCALGLEELVASELKTFGAELTETGSGAVTAKGSLESAYRACLWSRFSSRIFCQLYCFDVKNEDGLYQKALDLPWHEVLAVESTFAINCTISGKTKIQNNRFAALKLKDAIVDSFRNRTTERPSVQGRRPALQLHMHLAEAAATDQVQIFVDLSGESMHRRGYRVAGTVAPLKESLAAAIVALSGWKTDDNSALIDPMCGSGTILIEAAMMYGDVAPGLSRPYFGFTGWKEHNPNLWEQLIEEAGEREEAALDKKWPVFLGYDADPVAVSAARKNIAKAGLSEQIQIKQADLATLAPPSSKGTIVSNLPFGERLLEKELTQRLYRAFGRIVKSRFPLWKCSVFISNPDLTDAFTIKWQQKIKLFNGGIACRLLCADLALQQQETSFVFRLAETPKIPDEAIDFANRLKKNFLKLSKWAEKEEVSCYRLYDSDLPEFNFALDLYEKWFHLQEYAPPKSVSVEKAAERLRQAQLVIQAIFGVRSNHIFVKRRERQRGRKQYEKERSSGKMFEVSENGASLLVNFTDYLDTGLFLDHRPIRKKIMEEARGKRFLNLFGYTGSATIMAASGGAAETTTVDLSATYLDWARKNLAQNGFSEMHHKVVKADVMAWLQEERAKYDLIFLDPPTFSNTKKEKRVFDIQKDHAQLLRLTMFRLQKDGLLIFSTNFKKFIMDEGLEDEFEVTPLTDTVPFDYQRDPKIHKCWQFRLQQ